MPLYPLIDDALPDEQELREARALARWEEARNLPREALQAAWDAAHPAEQRAVLDELLGSPTQRGRLLVGASPLGRSRDYPLVFDLATSRWHDAGYTNGRGCGVFSLGQYVLGPCDALLYFARELGAPRSGSRAAEALNAACIRATRQLRDIERWAARETSRVRQAPPRPRSRSQTPRRGRR
jgi:hypothetical protein